jgi:hypothetical protein
MPRKEKKYHFIYKTTNLLSGKYYIGMHSSDDLEDGYLGSGKRLRYSINKHGAENHVREILEFADSREGLKKREEEIVSLNEIAKEKCMNLKVGGVGGLSGKKHYDNFTKAGIENFNKGKEKRHKKMLIEREKPEYRKNMSNSLFEYFENNNGNFSGKQHTEETKKLMSESKKGIGKGDKNSQYGTCWITRDGENKKIKKQELDSFTQKGWEKGRRLKN